MNYLLENAATDRLHFRPISENDFDRWLPFSKDPSSFTHWQGTFDTPEEECKKWFIRQGERYANHEGGMNALIEKSTGALVGYAGILLQQVDKKNELEIAYSLLPAFRGEAWPQKQPKRVWSMHLNTILPIR